MSGPIAPGDEDVLIVIDVQNDFCPGGSLAVPNGDKVVPLINRLSRRFAHVILTQDWHPAGHLSFASAHPGRQAFETVEAPYGPQMLWPDHCIQASAGAAFHSGLDIPHAELVLRKGFRPGIDSYSAFTENDRKTPTGLSGYLRERGLRNLTLAGLAFDFCVFYSAQDGSRDGFSVTVIEDACRAIDINGSAGAAKAALLERGVACVNASHVLHG